MQWYRSEMGQAAGPLSYEDLQAQAVAGRLTAADKVWSPGFPDWVSAADIPGLLPRRTLPPQVAAPPAPPAPASLATPQPLARLDATASAPPARAAENLQLELGVPRLAPSPSWPPPPPAKGAPMPASRKLANPVDPAAAAAAARARLLGPRPGATATGSPARVMPPPPAGSTGQHDRA